MPSVSVLFLALFLLVGAACATMPTQIDTTGGTVKGYVGARISYYSGIPFAAPPVGTNRFREPQPPTPWSGVRDATTMGNICPQAKIGSTLVLGNEDCLYLNVYVPSNHSVDANETLPVMFWIYGIYLFIYFLCKDLSGLSSELFPVRLGVLALYFLFLSPLRRMRNSVSIYLISVLLIRLLLTTISPQPPPQEEAS